VRIGVDQVASRDLEVAHLHQDARVLSFQESSGNSAGPEVDAGAGVLGDLGVDDDVGELQTTAGA